MSTQSFRNATLQDASRCFEIETLAYEKAEAATQDKIASRIAGYPEGFVVLEVDNHVVGFINSGCAHDVEMSDESFKDLIGHASDAPNVVIMSVVVDPACQGKGYSKILMEEFVMRMVAMEKKTIHLMCKEFYLPLYEKFGYHYVKPSASDYGGMQWHEMVMAL